MRKIRIAVLIATLLITLTALAGCNKLKIDKVEADPLKYLSEGMELTLKGTPFANIFDAGKKGSYQLVIGGEEINLDMKLYLDTEAEKGAVEIEADVPSEYDIDEVTGELITTATEKIALDAYYADKKLAIKSDLLKDFVGTDAIGFDTSVTEEDLKESALYAAMLSLLGVTEEDLTEAENSINVGDITKAFTDYINAAVEIGKNAYQVDEVAETTLTIGKKEVEAVVISLVAPEDIHDELVDEAVTMMVALSKAMGEEMTEEDIEAYKEEMKLSMPKMESESKYYLSLKTGAVVKCVEETEISMSDYGYEETALKTKTEIVYGADPTKLFLPSVNYEIVADGTKLAIKGESSIVEKKFVFDGEVKISGEGEEEGGTFKLELASDGKFNLTLVDEEEEIVLPGTFTSDKAKTELSIDLSAGYEEDEVAAITNIKLVITADENVPALPKYKDILDMTEEDLAPIMEMLAMLGGSDTGIYEMTVEDYYYELLYYYEEAELEDALDDYASEGYATREEMICDVYIGIAMYELTFYMDEESINNTVYTLVNEGYTYKEIADALYQMLVTYWMSDLEI